MISLIPGSTSARFVALFVKQKLSILNSAFKANGCNLTHKQLKAPSKSNVAVVVNCPAISARGDLTNPFSVKSIRAENTQKVL